MSCFVCRFGAWLALVGAAVGCSAAVTAERAPLPTLEPSAMPTRDAPSFSFTSLTGEQIDNQSLLGRMSIIGMVTTYDTPSQAQTRFLSGLMRQHVPRINVVLLVLEPPANRPLVEAYATALDVPYPVALADADTIAGRGPFSGMHHVPSVIVLDRDGREVWRHIGLVRQGELAAVLKRHEGSIRARRGVAP